MSVLESELAAVAPTDASPKLVAGMFGVVPGSPKLPAVPDLATMFEGLDEGELAIAQEMASSDAVVRVVKVGRGIDAGDTGLTIVTGVRSVFGLLFGGGDDKGLADSAQQKTDAVLKAAAMAWVITQLFPREGLEGAQRTLWGQALIRYFGAVEVALPFRDQVQAAEGAFVAKAVEERLQTVTSKLGILVGAAGVETARKQLAELVPVLDAEAMHCVQFVDALANTAKGYMPLLGGAAVTDLAAGGADALPVYRYLMARFAAQACRVRGRPSELEPPVDVSPSNPFFDPVDEDDESEAEADSPAEPAAAPSVASNPFADSAEVVPAPVAAPANPFADPVQAAPAAAAATNPFADPVEAAPPAGNPFADPVEAAPPAGNPFADPVEAAPPAGNPFADPVEAAPVAAAATNPFADPVVSDPAPSNPFADPVEAAPVAAAPSKPRSLPPLGDGPGHSLSGAYLSDSGAWWVFGPEGYVTRELPADGPPHDWQAHLDGGAGVGVYRRDATTLVVEHLDGGGALEVEQYAVVIDGERFARTDFDLSGRTLDGTWGPYRLSADGRFAMDGSPVPDGSYALGLGAITLRWEDGREDVRSFFSTLQPSSKRPARVYIGGEAFDQA